ncbi:MAG: hypothetical protein H5U10_04380 [Desulfacinum sp.]|nr:hypothetical protein [Desulfacinum sp.]
MKVSGPHSNVSVGQEPRRTESAPVDEAGAFGRILAQELDRETDGKTASGIEPPSVAGPTDLLCSDPKAPGERSAEDRILEVLEGLEDLAEQLSGNAARLKDVGRRLEDLGASAEEAWKAAQELAPDHPLRRIAEEARVVAYVESIKWGRGDYLGT